MNRDNPFDRLFRLGNNNRHWTDEMVEEFIESFNTPDSGFVTEGRRVENVNGEITEYELEDGEWVEVDDDSDGVTVEVTAGSDEPIRATIDLSSKIGLGKPKSVASATFNNGILDVEFEYDSDE